MLRQGVHPGRRTLGLLLPALRRLSTPAAGALRVAVVGSGPGGFYTARTLLKKHPGVEVDVVEMLPVPFGLVRYGVAPDHADTKNVTAEFQGILDSPDCSFIGNVKVGRDVTLEELQGLYHAVVMSYGAEQDRVLGVPGEELDGALSARAFVNWFNGHPHYATLNPPLASCERAVVVGNGNVAVDVARILLKPPSLLATTDIADAALEALGSSKVRQVDVVGRRGAAQAAWTTAELREITRLPGVRVVMQPNEVALDEMDTASVNKARADKRRYQLLQETLQNGGEGEKELHLRFLQSPMRIVAAAGGGSVGGVVLGRNRLEGEEGRRKAVSTGEEEEIACGMVLRSVGYRSLPIDGLPFTTSSSTVPHGAGRVLAEDGGGVKGGMYVAGWLKRGPTGIIGTNISDGQITAMSILEDFAQGKLRAGAVEGGDGLRALLASRGVTVVSNEGWQRIDTHERVMGEAAGRPRRKLATIEEMLAVADVKEV